MTNLSLSKHISYVTNSKKQLNMSTNYHSCQSANESIIILVLQDNFDSWPYNYFTYSTIQSVVSLVPLGSITPSVIGAPQIQASVNTIKTSF